jgi:AraC-like DNA-binding protein
MRTPRVTNPARRRTRFTRHDSELGSWEAVYGEPAPRLRPHVRGAYVSFIESATSFVRRLEVPWPGVALIINFGAATRVTMPEQRDGSEEFSAFVGGLCDTYVHVESTGPSRAIQVNLTPLGAYRVLGSPMDAIANRCVALDDVLGAQARLVAERLAEAHDWEERFDLIDAFLGRRLDISREPSAAVAWAWNKLLETGGTVPVGTLATELGWSRKHLVSRFHEQIGLAPKTMARIVRFDRVVALIDSADGMAWTDIALRCGYYDQAHLIHDFNQFAGSTPGEFVARRLPDGGGVIAD